MDLFFTKQGPTADVDGLWSISSLTPCCIQSLHGRIFCHVPVPRETYSEQWGSLQIEWPKYMKLCYLDTSLVMKNPYRIQPTTSLMVLTLCFCGDSLLEKNKTPRFLELILTSPQFHGEDNGSQNANSPRCSGFHSEPVTPPSAVAPLNRHKPYKGS